MSWLCPGIDGTDIPFPSCPVLWWLVVCWSLVAQALPRDRWLSQEAESLSWSARHHSSIKISASWVPSYDSKEAKIQVEAWVYSANLNLVVFFFLLLKSRICKNNIFFFLLDFQVVARCSYVRLDLSNTVWKGSVQQKGMFEGFLAFWLCGQPLGIPAGTEISAAAPCSWEGPSHSMAFQKWALLKWRLFQFKCHWLDTFNYRWFCGFSQI